MHDQMSGYKRLRRDHQASLARLEESCRQEMEKHKQMLDREYEQLLTQFSRELERLQLKHQDEVKFIMILQKNSYSWFAVQCGVLIVWLLIFLSVDSFSSTLLGGLPGGGKGYIFSNSWEGLFMQGDGQGFLMGYVEGGSLR